MSPKAYRPEEDPSQEHQSQAASIETPSVTASPLADASDEIKLAVDLIYLLETHAIAPQVALDALAIVSADLRAKIAASEDDTA
ncbi:DUF2496 domain-containing protein [Shewanella algidipiscicola]|uniref:DUF2496 domain-containing protein n=1 Tax=Shewanella algidipiscicola TaxID=614070 RepID=UPI00194FDD3B|nr:DUF2496 domain-containing protein [Shewanella algidipiscicola]